jgi:hypothetical protein
MTDYEPIEITAHTDHGDPAVQRVTVAAWPERARVRAALIGVRADGVSIALEGTVRVVVANGEAVYRVVGFDEATGALLLHLDTATGPS